MQNRGIAMPNDDIKLSKLEIKFQADALRHQIMSFVVALDKDPELRDVLYEDEFAAFTKTYEVLKKLIHICEK